MPINILEARSVIGQDGVAGPVRLWRFREQRITVYQLAA